MQNYENNFYFLEWDKEERAKLEENIYAIMFGVISAHIICQQ